MSTCANRSACMAAADPGRDAVEWKPLHANFQQMEIVVKVKGEALCKCEGSFCDGVNGGCSRSFKISADALKQIGNDFFVKLNRKDPSIRRMMCCLVERSQNGRYSDGEIVQVLGKVSVVDDLIKEREIAVKMVARQCAMEKAINMKKRWKQNKKHAGTLLTIPNVVEFKSPEYGDLPGVTLRTLSARTNAQRGTQAIWMAINSESVTWLTNAIDWQYHNAAVTRAYVSCRNRTKARRSVAPIKDGSNDDDRRKDGNNDDDDQDDDDSDDDDDDEQGGDGNESGDKDNDEGGTGSDGSSEQAPQSSPGKVVDDEAGTVRGAVAAS